MDLSFFLHLKIFSGQNSSIYYNHLGHLGRITAQQQHWSCYASKDPRDFYHVCAWQHIRTYSIQTVPGRNISMLNPDIQRVHQMEQYGSQERSWQKTTPLGTSCQET